MDKVIKNFQMVIFILDNIVMVFLKDMDSIFGVMEVLTKEISNKGLGMDMVYGEKINIKIVNIIKVITYQIKDQVMEFINGIKIIIIKEIFLKIKDMDKDNFIMIIN